MHITHILPDVERIILLSFMYMCGKGECAHVVPLERRREWWSCGLLWAVQSACWELNSSSIWHKCDTMDLKHHLHFAACGHVHGAFPWLLIDARMRAYYSSATPGKQVALDSMNLFGLIVWEVLHHDSETMVAFWCYPVAGDPHIVLKWEAEKSWHSSGFVILLFFFYAILACSPLAMLPIQGQSFIPR